jgi:hypothetical protein
MRPEKGVRLRQSASRAVTCDLWLVILKGAVGRQSHTPPTEDRGSPSVAGGGSTDKRFEKVRTQTSKLPKFTKPFFCLSIPTARLRINRFFMF